MILFIISSQSVLRALFLNESFGGLIFERHCTNPVDLSLDCANLDSILYFSLVKYLVRAKISPAPHDPAHFHSPLPTSVSFSQTHHKLHNFRVLWQIAAFPFLVLYLCKKSLEFLWNNFCKIASGTCFLFFARERFFRQSYSFEAQIQKFLYLFCRSPVVYDPLNYKWWKINWMRFTSNVS